MKRNEMLKALGIETPFAAIKKVIIDTDAKNEADDQFAIMHFLLTPTIDILGICAAHFEKKDKSSKSMEKSYNEIKKVLSIANINDVKVLKGNTNSLGIDSSDSEATDFIIKSANENNHIFICCLGALTNVASALKKAPEIAKKMTIIVNGGGPYPIGRAEFNFLQDIDAVNVVFKSEAEIWQIHQDVYSSLEVSISELKYKVYPCGKIGEYLFNNLIEENFNAYNPRFLLRTGENWTLGDNSTIGVLLMNHFRGQYHMEDAPYVLSDGRYKQEDISKEIRVYDYIDSRFILEDFFSKLNLVYK